MIVPRCRDSGVHTLMQHIHRGKIGMRSPCPSFSYALAMLCGPRICLVLSCVHLQSSPPRHVPSFHAPLANPGPRSSLQAV